MLKPNFFIVGAPKAGTTSLYYYLDEHPEIYMSPIKETNFFSYKEIREQGLFYGEEHINTIAQYEAQFKNAGVAKAIGEASVSYLFYASVPQKIKAYNPLSKIIIILRNPIDRGYSHYLMDKRLGFVDMPYEAILHRSKNSPKIDLYYQQYISLGFYHLQVKRYLETFSPCSIKILLYDDILNDIVGTVKEIYQFLEVDKSFLPQVNLHHNTFSQPKNVLIEKLYANRTFRKFVKSLAGNKGKSLQDIFMTKDKKPKLTDTIRMELLDLYRSDIVSTSQLINRNLDNWT